MFLRYLFLKSFLVLANYPKLVHSICKVDEDMLSCQYITIEEFHVEYFKRMWRYNTTQITKLEILDANIPRIDHLYNLPNMGDLTSLKISGCGITEVFDDEAFNDFGNLTQLDLSYNLLEEALFIEELPRSMFVLLLNNNAITYLDTDFSDWPNLAYVDLSHNLLKIIKLDHFLNIFDVNLSYNELYNLIPSEHRILGYKNPSKLNLYHNEISMFYEKDFNMVLDWLDLGENRLKMVSMTFNKRFIGFANSVVEQFLGEIHTSVANLTNVEGLNNLKIIGKYIVLAKNKFNEIGLDLNDIRRFYNFDYNVLDFLDLSNCSITDIPDLYFSNIPHCINLNLSYNSIDVIKKMTFKNSKIDILDLSHSNIKELQSHCFTNNTMIELRLSNNQISQLNEIFFNTTLLKLDLSYNQIFEIPINSFKNLLGMRYLNLSHNFIEKLNSSAISEIKSLDILDLNHNRFINFDSDSFAYFSVKDLLLQGNNISSVQKNAFDHLMNVKFLNLSNNHIQSIRPKAFANLSNIEEIDLSNNDINFVVADMFFQTPNLHKVDLSGNPLKQIFKISKSLALNELIITVDSVLNSDEIDNFYLKILTIKDSKLEALNANTFRGLYTLRSLNFENTTIDVVEPGALNNLFSLQYLDTKHIFNGTTDLPEDTFKDLVQLEQIDLSEIGLETMHQWTFNGLESLTYLNLNHNKFVELVNGNFLGLPVLSNLLLEFNNISTMEDGAFNGLYSLKQLTLANNKLVGINDGAFKHLWRLNKLNLQNNLLIKLGKDVFEGLVNLIELNLSNNRLTVIPSGSFHYLKELKSLLLQYNTITILDVGCLSELKLLEVLDISHNELTYFNTRTTFLTLKKLLQLYLDHNELNSLDINELLNKCPSLKFVGLSFNDFVCDDLALILLMLENHEVAFKSIVLGYDSENIEGIQCVAKNQIKYKHKTIAPESNKTPMTENNLNDFKKEPNYFIKEKDSVEEGIVV